MGSGSVIRQPLRNSAPVRRRRRKGHRLYLRDQFLLGHVRQSLHLGLVDICRWALRIVCLVQPLRHDGDSHAGTRGNSGTAHGAAGSPKRPAVQVVDLK